MHVKCFPSAPLQQGTPLSSPGLKDTGSSAAAKDNQIDRGIEILDILSIAHFGSFNAQSLSVAVDALTRGTLGVDGVVERAMAIPGSRASGHHVPS